MPLANCWEVRVPEALPASAGSMSPRVMYAQPVTNEKEPPAQGHVHAVGGDQGKQTCQALVFCVVTWVLMTIAALIAFLIGQAALSGHHLGTSLGSPGAARGLRRRSVSDGGRPDPGGAGR